jgi:hypothetical protein
LPVIWFYCISWEQSVSRGSHRSRFYRFSQRTENVAFFFANCQVVTGTLRKLEQNLVIRDLFHFPDVDYSILKYISAPGQSPKISFILK